MQYSTAAAGLLQACQGCRTAACSGAGQNKEARGIHLKLLPKRLQWNGWWSGSTMPRPLLADQGSLAYPEQQLGERGLGQLAAALLRTVAFAVLAGAAVTRCVVLALYALQDVEHVLPLCIGRAPVLEVSLYALPASSAADASVKQS